MANEEDTGELPESRKSQSSNTDNDKVSKLGINKKEDRATTISESKSLPLSD